MKLDDVAGPAASADADDQLGLDEILTRVEAALAGDRVAGGYEPVAPIAQLAAIFGLTDDATELLAIVIAADVDPVLAELLAGRTGGASPTVDLALRLGVDIDVLGPAAPLRRWRLVELSGAASYTERRLTPDPRIVDFALGVDQLDVRLEGLARPIGPTGARSAREDRLIDDVVGIWRTDGFEAVVSLSGSDRIGRRVLAANAADRCGRRGLWVRGDDIPTDWSQRFGMATFLDREMALAGSVTVIDVGAQVDGATALTELMHGPVVLCADQPIVVDRRPYARVEVPDADATERAAEWSASIRGADGDGDDGTGSTQVDLLAEQFALGRTQIELVVGRARRSSPDRVAFDDLWQLARVEARGGLDDVARRIETTRRWDDLVLPPEPLAQLRALAAEVRHSATVRRTWGWADRSERGLGTAALFAGPSGTGKTLAAEVIANDLALDLYRVDLSQVISKWIGETEKNLARIFSAAESGGAILLFDEADALFGKRTEVRDSHDRYANVEVSYLLQRMEAYRGVAILTTNLRSTLDRAFLRRIRHCVTFPFPDQQLRTALWTRVFPPSTPTEGVDPAALAMLTLTGGSIQAVALNACFLAAADDAPVQPRHVLVAARREFDKLEKPMSRAEIEALS